MPTESWAVLSAVSVLLCAALAAVPPRSRHKRAAPGRVVAVVSVRDDGESGHGESGHGRGGDGPGSAGNGRGGGGDPHATVRSLTGQSRPVDAVHVVSVAPAAPAVPVTPADPADHPSVTWHRQPYGGRRAALATVIPYLRRQGRSYDYVLTVDAGCEVHKDAVWQMLRVLNDPRVQACTGTVLTRDRRAGLVARLTDLRLFVLCVLGRGPRSAVGAARPAPGGISLYRAPVLSEHLGHYVASGADGGDDDRRLCGYARSRGRVVSVPRAHVTADAPATLKDTYRQQLGRGRRARRLVRWELATLPAAARVTRLAELGAGALLPLVSLGLVADAWRTGSAAPLLHALAAVGVFTMAEALLYAVLRPGLSRVERLTAPLLAPLHAAVMFFVVHPATYWSLIRPGPDGRRTRERTEAPVAASTEPAEPTEFTEPAEPAPKGPNTPAGTPPGVPRAPRPPRSAPPQGPAKLLDPLTEQTLETSLRTRTTPPS